MVYIPNEMIGFPFDHIWPLVEPTVRRAHGSLLDAISNATRMEDQHPELVRDGIMWAGHVRGYLARDLDVFIDGDAFALERGFNISLTFHSPSSSLRILKADPGKLPQPGNSQGRLNYFNQNLGQFVFFDAEAPDREDEPEFAPNFILKWSVDDQRSLCELDLAYPKPTVRELFVAGAQEPMPQDWYWCESVFDLSKPIYAVRPTVYELKDVADVRLLGDDMAIDEEEKGKEGTGE